MNRGHVGTIIQARMGSSRLPGKVMEPIRGVPMLGMVVQRLQNTALAGPLVIATSDGRQDDRIAEFAKSAGVNVFRGSETDVLGRYFETARKYEFGTIVRITADCPLIDPAVVVEAIEIFLTSQPRLDYLSNTVVRSYPRGLDCEVFSFSALKQAHEESTDPLEREHVTPFIYRRPERYRLGWLVCDVDRSEFRWTVDTKEDLTFVRRLCGRLQIDGSAPFSSMEILQAQERFPELMDLNKDVEQISVPMRADVCELGEKFVRPLG